MANEVNYGEWKLPQLREELKKRGVKVSGRKKELVDRLCGLDNLGRLASQNIEPEFVMDVPEPKAYQDIHAGMSTVVTISQQRLIDYLRSNEKEYDEKVEEMYNERYVRFIRVADGDGKQFLRGCVWAEMRKNVSYDVDVSIDQNGVVQEAQCDCAAGQGPTAHCKHVACILYCVVQFGKCKKIITEVTCTQRLQTFHHAKAYRSSPMKAAKLHDMRGHSFRYDPRPEEYRNQEGYPDHFQNAVINYQASCGTNNKMPVVQLYQPANPHALNFMHDYVMRSDEAFLRKSKVHCNPA
ncbi:PREDICTED: uncharacterized protein LOC106815391 [Priapulus caudatus]|uniref:Uncharacterized protein LOC106815391 n=1 Tax=Priapulus caudatus TaxID=37621 RepID=A0ABM1ET07_PRICU|nr:PREDICTED: uncharacterized protein LOC106815391 [Priapulus caudatus]